ncbi:UDP-Glycosyltransferase/glycogen phosphorylase [Aspergillus spinulosporus]
MAGKETGVPEDCGINEDYAPPPPYSPARSSVTSSEISLWTTIEPDFPPEFSNGSRGVNKYSDGKFLLNTSISSRTSAFIQAFMRPKASPRLIDVGSESLMGDGTNVAVPNPESLKPQPLDIVVMVVDEDIEPFVYIAKHLLRDSHRVRIAASAGYESFVRSQGLDFFCITQRPVHDNDGVDDHGQVSNLAGDRVSEIRHQQVSLFKTYSRCWSACIAPYNGDSRPFLSDVIIANPTAHAHFHCAERLSIPLHIMSTMPQTLTKAFPHPRARFNSSDGVDQATANMLSYGLVEEHTWFRSIEPINRFRQSVLGLAAIPSTTAARLMIDNRIPHTYFCSKLFIPKPDDWPERHEISGYILREPGEPYQPAKDLVSFVSSDRTIVYFMMQENSIRDSSSLATIIQEAVLQRGFRAILPETWLHISSALDNSNVIVVDSGASEWLLPRVSLVVHNGDTECVKSALRHGKACVTIAQTEDHRRLGAAVAKIGAGASPISIQRLKAEEFTQAIEYCLRPDIQQATRAAQTQLIGEGGVESAVRSFYRWLPASLKQVCSITRESLAVFRVWNRPSLLISAAVAAVLLQERRIKPTDLVLINHCVYETQPKLAVSPSGITRDYWDGFTNAARDIVNASDLVSKLPGLRKKENTPENKDGIYRSKPKTSPAREVGIGTAKFFGNIALLPFTSTALVVNSAIYAVKSVQEHISHDKTETLREASYDVHYEASSYSRSRERLLTAAQCDHRYSLTKTTDVDQIQLRNDQHILAIFRRYLGRGAQSRRINDEKLRQDVLDTF